MCNRCQKLNRILVSARIPSQMLTKNTLALVVVMVFSVGEDNTKQTHQRRRKTMRILETSKQTTFPCVNILSQLFFSQIGPVQKLNPGIQFILCDLGVLDWKLVYHPVVYSYLFFYQKGFLTAVIPVYTICFDAD